MDQLFNEAGLEPLKRKLDRMFPYTVLLLVTERLERAREVNYIWNKGEGFQISERFLKVDLIYNL